MQPVEESALPRTVTEESEFKRSMFKMFRENKWEKNVQRSKGKIRNHRQKRMLW